MGNFFVVVGAMALVFFGFELLRYCTKKAIILIKQHKIKKGGKSH